MKSLKLLLIALSILLIGYIGWNAYMPRTAMYSAKAIVAEVSPANGIKVVIEEDMGWAPVLQILVILLGTYGGIKVINKYTAKT